MVLIDTKLIDMMTPTLTDPFGIGHMADRN